VADDEERGGVDEAPLRSTPEGDAVDGPGWFVLNVGEARWGRHEALGTWYMPQADAAPFPHYGIGIHVLRPGESNGRYHAETAQEDFLVLAGECLAIVEGQERPLRTWDHLHCPPGTRHILVGAGDGPCAILMVGGRFEGKTTHYPVDAVAARHGVSVAAPADSGRVAYADLDFDGFEDVPSAFPFRS
jgi:uncharacterized cupin superfamily protein